MVRRKKTSAQIYNLTDGRIQTVLKEFSTKKSINGYYGKKVIDWEDVFGKITEEDFDFIYDKFGLTYESVMGYPMFFSAQDMADYIRKTIKGQDDAIDQLAVPFFLHYAQTMINCVCPSNKSVMLIGPTGCGKTELVTLLAEVTGFPLIVINSSECTANGWRGASISDVIANQAKKYKPDELARAILYIDEIDKITHHGCNQQTDDLSFDMQREIMNLTDSRNPVRLNMGVDKSFNQSFMELPVDKMLIIFSGAFVGMDKIIDKRLNIASKVGFSTKSADSENHSRKATPQDLVNWGFLSELVGRIGPIVTLKSLDKNVLYEIVTESKKSILNALASYSKNAFNTTLRFTEGALRMICAQAETDGLGFRGVQTLLSACMSKAYYDKYILNPSNLPIEIDENFIYKNSIVK